MCWCYLLWYSTDLSLTNVIAFVWALFNLNTFDFLLVVLSALRLLVVRHLCRFLLQCPVTNLTTRLDCYHVGCAGVVCLGSANCSRYVLFRDAITVLALDNLFSTSDCGPMLRDIGHHFDFLSLPIAFVYRNTNCISNCRIN